MFLPPEIPELFQAVDFTTLRVHPPSKIILLCGGEIDFKSNFPKSFRNAFALLTDKPILQTYTIIIPEENNPFEPNSRYRNWLDFEGDLAQICELVVLFSESYGSAAELGAFAVELDISGKILVGIDSNTYSESSFIRSGPIKYLVDTYGSSSLVVMENSEIGISSLSDFQNINMDRFQRYLSDAIRARAHRSDEHTTFNPKRNGHRIKLICGLVQHYGALDFDEISAFLFSVDIAVKDEELEKLLFCASVANWLGVEQFGSRKFAFTKGGNEAIQYKALDGLFFSKERWIAQVAEFVRLTDADRFSAITRGLREQLT